MVFGQKNPSNSIKLVAMKIITNRKKKWREERGLNLKIKVTSGYFCGQEMLSYIVATKVINLIFKIFRFFWFPRGVPPP